MPYISFPREAVKEYKYLKLADPFLFEKLSVDILLGNDVMLEFIKNNPIHVM